MRIVVALKQFANFITMEKTEDSAEFKGTNKSSEIREYNIIYHVYKV